MDLALIRYFNAVVRRGSFSAAARELGITQPGLTKAVRRLESSLEAPLFRRLQRGVELTEQGRVLLRHVSRFDVELADARAEVRAMGSAAAGALRIGAGPSWLSRALPRVVAELAAAYPQLTFQIVGGFNAGLMESLQSGELDLVVSALPDREPPGLRAIPLTSDRLAVVARRGHPLQKRRRLGAAATLDYRWALPGRDVLSRVRLEALFRVEGLEPPQATVESDSISFIAATLRDSDMLSFATLQILASDMPGVAPLPARSLTMTRSAGILHRASTGMTPAMTALIGALKRRTAEMVAN